MRKPMQVGEKYGRLTVKEFSHKDEKSRKWWKCVCVCGNETILHTGNLRSGNTKSCGCLAKELSLARKGLQYSDVGQVLAGYKRHAKSRNLEWSLSREEAEKIIRSQCFYCGDPGSNCIITKHTIEPLRYNGIDRVDNDKGYTTNNVVPCCRTCNRAKLDMSFEDFSKWAKRLGTMATQWSKYVEENVRRSE